MSPDALLTIERLSRDGLSPVDLVVSAGEIIVISGPSGAGKSILLRAIADLDPNEGRVLIADQERSDLTAPAWRQRATYLPAESGWWADTVGAHYAAPADAARTAARLGLPDDVMDWRVERLSTGEKQRLALVRALEGSPDVLLLDEPTSGLDPKATEQVEALILESCRAGACALVVSHITEQADRLGGRRFTVTDGVLSAEDAP